MRKTIYFLLLCILNNSAFAEYSELQSIEKLSKDKVFEYVNQFMMGDKNLEGVINYAMALQDVFDTNDTPENKIAKLTYENVNYWRAAMERTPRDSSVLFSTAYLYAAYGKVPYSDIYFVLGSMNASKDIQKELNDFKEMRDKLYEKLNREISDGIKFHDEGQYEKAIEVYDRAIKEYPEAAQFYYEKGLSYMMESRSKNDPNLKEKAFELFKVCREKDPFLWSAYQGDDPNNIKKLRIFIEKVAPFYSGRERDPNGFTAFAEGCEEMELYPFAAHAQLKLSLIDQQNAKEHMSKFFDLIKKSGCKEADSLRTMFAISMINKSREQAPGRSGEWQTIPLPVPITSEPNTSNGSPNAQIEQNN